MQLPNFIRVGFRPVTIVRHSDDETDGGYYKDSPRELMVDSTEPEHQQGLATLHEITHLALAEHDVEMNDDLEERVCDAVSRVFAEIIVRNPNLLPTIQEALTK